MTVVRSDIHENEKATTVGFHQSAYSVGMVLGPVGAGYVGEAFGYEGLFASTAVIGLLAAAASLRLPAK